MTDRATVAPWRIRYLIEHIGALSMLADMVCCRIVVERNRLVSLGYSDEQIAQVSQQFEVK